MLAFYVRVMFCLLALCCARCFYVSVSFLIFFFKQKTAYEMRISDWSSDVCSSDLNGRKAGTRVAIHAARQINGVAMFCGSREISEPGRKLLVQWSNKAGAKQGIHKLRRGHRGGNVLDRKSAVEGQGVSVRVDIGGRRHNKNKHRQREETAKK